MARYQERIATSSLEDKDYVRETIALLRRESKRLMIGWYSDEAAAKRRVRDINRITTIKEVGA